MMTSSMASSTPFYPKRKTAIADAYNRLDRTLLTNWLLSFHSGKPIMNCEGRQVQYGGVEFSGSPRDVFWGGFFEPDFKKVITEQINQTVMDCQPYPSLAESALDETARLAHDFVGKLYERMAEIDQRLRGKGFPETVQRRSVGDKISAMNDFIDEHTDAAKQLAALSQWGELLLEQEQKDLLMNLAEGARNVPPNKRQPFILSQTHEGDHLIHPGLKQVLLTYFGDIDTLANAGLTDVSMGSNRTVRLINVTPKGFSYYRYLKRETGKLAQRVENETRQYILSTQFKSDYVAAYQKWVMAEALLWGADSEQQYTTIGHHCREAMQEFADALIKRRSPSNVEPDKAKTVARVRAILELYAVNLGRTEKAFLDALLVYWGTVSDLTQRQEHGSQNVECPLIWEDARRVIFQTLLVIFEVDRALSR